MYKALFEVAQPKQKKYCYWVMEIIFWIKYHLLNMNLHSKFLLLRWFFKNMVTSLYSSSPNFQIDNAVTNNKKIIAKVKILNKGLCLKEDVLLKTWFMWPRTSVKYNNNNSIFCFVLVVLPEFFSIKEFMV